MEGHEEGAEADAEDDRQDRVQRPQAEGRPGEAGDHGGEYEIAGEPERRLVPDLAVTLVAGNVIDRTHFDLRA